MADCVLRRKIPRYDPHTDYGYQSEHHHHDHEDHSRREKQIHYGNIMTDPRIWRGNTYCMYRNQTLLAKQAEEKHQAKRLMKARATSDNDYHRKMRKTRLTAVYENTPVAGRKHGAVQTELFLQEMAVRISEAEKANQTEEFLERPASPVFVQAKTGLDVSTQILDNELFLFDVEVMPILEVLNGKVVEQAFLEVMQEEELAEIRAQHRAFQTIQNFERAEQQRLVDEQRQRREEKETRKRERRELMKREVELSEKLAAQAFATSYLQSLIPNVFQRLKEDGVFLDPARAELDVHMVPWLLERVSQALDEETAINLVMGDLLKDVMNENEMAYARAWETLLEPAGEIMPEKPAQETQDAPAETVTAVRSSEET